MNLWGAVKALAAPIVNAVSTAVTYCAERFGGSTGRALVEAGKTIGPSINVNPNIVTTVGVIALGVGTILGITSANDRLDIIGEKAMLPDSKSPEEFDSQIEYLDYLKNDVKLDESVLENKTPEERQASTFIGTNLVSKGIEEKSNMTIPTEFWVKAGEKEMESEEVVSYMESFKEEGIDDMGVMSDYLEGSCDPNFVEQAGDAIKKAVENFNPDLTNDEIESKIDSLMIKDDVSAKENSNPEFTEEEVEAKFEDMMIKDVDFKAD